MSRSPKRKLSPTRHSPPPAMARSHSPLRDAVSLVVDSDDEEEESDASSAARRTATPELGLASTHSESDEGSRAPNKSDDGRGDDGNDHAVSDAPPIAAAASSGSAVSAASAAIAIAAAAASAPKLTAAELDRHESRIKSKNNGTSDSQDDPHVPLSMCNAHSAANSGISHWRRTDINISTGPRSSVSLNGSHDAHNTKTKSQCYNSSNAVDITPLHQIPYVHGGYAAAAPLFVTHSKFASILKKLLPGAYEELSVLLRSIKNGSKTGTANGRGRSASNGSSNAGEHGGDGLVKERRPMLTSCSPHHEVEVAYDGVRNGDTVEPGVEEMILPDPVKVMKWAENNPVVSAFGIWNSDSGRRTIKFMQGINLCYDGENNPVNDGAGIFNDFTDRESVITLGSNSMYNRTASGAYNQGRHRQNGNLPYVQRSRRRKQPLPEDESAPGSNYGGMESESKPSYGKPALEWDVFLDPHLVRQVDAAMGVVDDLEVKIRRTRLKREKRVAARSQTKQPKPQPQNDDDESNDDDFDILQAHTAAQVEVDRLVSQLMRRTIIAHGSMSQLVLEAMGVAPKYNFGTVVKASRDGVAGHSASIGRVDNNPSSPSRSMKRVSLRAGNTELSLDMTQTLTWDEDEEQRDFEALLDPTMMGGKGRAGTKRRTTTAGSKGMFLENWLHVFARTLSLLVKSSSGGTDAIMKKGSSSSRSDDSGLLVKNKPANIGQRGLSGLFERMFRRDSSYRDPLRQGSVGAADERSFDLGHIEETNEMADGDTPNRLLDDEELLTNNDMFLPQTPNAATSTLGAMCGMSLCLGYDGEGDAGASTRFPMNPHASAKMAQDIERIAGVLGEPLRLVLDLKSRRVPPRVWSRLIDSLRTRGLIIEGIGSFDMDELRVIEKGCTSRLTPILFFHSVGDLQRACHANEVKNGDTVYFNGGSLMWKRSRIMEAAERGCCGAIDTADDAVTAGEDGVTGGRLSSPKAGSSGNYSFQPYAYPRSALSDWERSMCKSTIEDYRRHFNLKIGVYVQEFSISAEALDALSIFVNKHGGVYDQGLAFGGINGTSVKNIRGDGYWNQRYMGRSWDFDARPSKEMTPLKPEDHHLVQKAIQAGAWGQVGTIFEVNDEQEGALTVLPPPREPCNIVNDF